MAKSYFLSVIFLALVCGQAVAQGNSKDRAPEPPEKARQAEKKNKRLPRQTGSVPNTTEPSKNQGGPTQQPNPEIVPPEGPQAGISSEAQQPHDQQTVVPLQPQEIGAVSQAEQGLQRRIEKALQNEPTLTNANVQVGVEQGAITLEGTVQSGRDKRTAARIANSFAGDRKVVDNVTVAGQ